MNFVVTHSDLAAAFQMDPCHLCVPSLPDRIGPTVNYLVEFARECGSIDPHRANRVLMALHEALTNAIIHGNLGISSELKDQGDDLYAAAVAARSSDPAFARRVVEIRAHYNGTCACWTLTDQGDGFDVEAALWRLDHVDTDPLRPSGRGILMMRAFMDEVHYDEGGRRVRLLIRRRDTAV
jgi:anti-sigma regulatory factor (Ser/Thr protein kinase)